MVEEGTEGRSSQGGVGGAALAGVLGAAVNSTRVDELVERQIALANLQIEDMEKDNAVRSRTLRLVEFSALMKVAFEIAAALVIAAIALVLIAAIWSASHAQGVIIEVFQVPPSLAEQGLSGQVVASRIQDKLADLQAKTDSIRAPGSYQNNWGNDIKVQIPDTGVSIGEFNRYLHAVLGHETHITGEVWRSADGISVVARAGMESGNVVSGKESDLDSLLQKAAESVYEKTQPYRYAVYLGEQGHNDAAIAVLRRLIATAPPREQAWAYMDWGVTLFGTSSDWRKALSLVETAEARDPDNADTWNSLALGYSELDREELQLQASLRSVRLFERGRADLNPGPAESSRLLLLVNAAELRGDYGEALRLNANLKERQDFDGTVSGAILDQSYDFGGLHDPAAVARLSRQFGQVVGSNVLLRFEELLTLAAADTGLRDWSGVVKNHDAFEALFAQTKPADREYFRANKDRYLEAQYALALAKLGNPKAAEAAIASTPSDCDTCLRARGWIAASERQWARANFWFARATAHAPSIPAGYEMWGEELLGKGDVDGAIAKFDVAHQKGPHFADPLEMWGEALIAQNRSDLALVKFEQAAKYAPNWKHLHQKWGEALSYVGRKDEAAKQFAIARSLDG